MNYKKLMMSEIHSKEGSNGFKAVSTFSGAGGSCMGLKLAGFDVLWANEFIPLAQQVYTMNHKNTFLETRDIRKVSVESILKKINLKKKELDLLEGSPPCSSFSTAGARQKKWGQIKRYSDTQQRCDDLFMEFARLLEGLQPKLFITENVNALAHKNNKVMFNTIYTHLCKAGYNVKAYILNSKDYNCPQNRKRLFFMGSRKDLNIEINPPSPLQNKVIVKEAVPFWTKYPHEELNITKDTKTYQLLKYAQDHKYSKLSDAHKKIYGKDSMFTHYVINHNTLSPTILATSSFYHNIFPRYISIDEVKRIQTFPDDFKLIGSYRKQWERCGRSVPPRMMEQIGLKIKELLEMI